MEPLNNKGQDDPDFDRQELAARLHELKQQEHQQWMQKAEEVITQAEDLLSDEGLNHE